MKAKTLTDLVAEHRDQLAELTQQIGELNQRVNERDAMIRKLKSACAAVVYKHDRGMLARDGSSAIENMRVLIDERDVRL